MSHDHTEDNIMFVLGVVMTAKVSLWRYVNSYKSPAVPKTTFQPGCIALSLRTNDTCHSPSAVFQLLIATGK